MTAVFHPSRSGAPVGLVVKIVLADGTETLHRQQAGAPRRELATPMKTRLALALTARSL